MRVPSTLLLVGIAALAIALLPLPYVYYTLLRVVMCGLFSYLAYLSWQSGGQELTWVCGVIAAIYNPFVPLHLGREVWVLVNIAAMGVLAYLLPQCGSGGEGGIRTLDTLLTYTPLAGERLQPLGHFSGK